MILSGTVIGFICVGALLASAVLLAVLDKREKGRGNTDKARFLSRGALILFLLAFVGGVAVTLAGGIRPREDGETMTGRPMSGETPPPMAAIGQIDPAEMKALQEKVEKDPKDVKSRERLGHLFLQQQDFENVFRMAHEALKINPRSVESRVHMGMVYFAMQQLDQSIEQFDLALKDDPDNLEGLMFKGIVLFQGKQDMKGAKEAWGRFMKLAKPSDTGYQRVKMFLQMVQN